MLVEESGGGARKVEGELQRLARRPAISAAKRVSLLVSEAGFAREGAIPVYGLAQIANHVGARERGGTTSRLDRRGRRGWRGQRGGRGLTLGKAPAEGIEAVEAAPAGERDG